MGHEGIIRERWQTMESCSRTGLLSPSSLAATTSCLLVFLLKYDYPFLIVREPSVRPATSEAQIDMTVQARHHRHVKGSVSGPRGGFQFDGPLSSHPRLCRQYVLDLAASQSDQVRRRWHARGRRRRHATPARVAPHPRPPTVLCAAGFHRV